MEAGDLLRTALNTRAPGSELYNAIITGLKALLDRAQQYDVDPAAVDKAARDWCLRVTPLLNGGQPVVIQVDGSQILINGVGPAWNSQSERTAAALFAFLDGRGIHNLWLQPGFDEHGAAALARALHRLQPGEVVQAHDVAAVDELGIPHVLKNLDPSGLAGSTQPAWELSGEQLDALDYDFSLLGVDPKLHRWDLSRLASSRRFVSYLAGGSVERLDRIVRQFEAIEHVRWRGQPPATLFARMIEPFIEGIAGATNGRQHRILTRRLARVVCSRPSEFVVELLLNTSPRSEKLRAEIVDVLRHDETCGVRVMQAIAASCSSGGSPDRFLAMTHTFGDLLQHFFASKQLESTLVVLKMLEYLRRSRATHPMVRKQISGILLRFVGQLDVESLIIGCTATEKERSDICFGLLLRLGRNISTDLLNVIRTSDSAAVRLAAVEVLATLLPRERSIDQLDFGSAYWTLIHQMEQDAGSPWYFRRNLVTLTRKIGDERFLKWISRYTRDNDRRVRREAAIACAEYGTPNACARLLQSLQVRDIQDLDDFHTITEAVLHDPGIDGVSYLSCWLNESVPGVIQIAAMRKIASLPGIRAIEILDQVLNEKTGLLARKPRFGEDLRAIAAEELGWRDAEEARQALRRSSETVRSASTSP